MTQLVKKKTLNLLDLPNEILEKIIDGLEKKNTLGINKRFYNLTKNKKFKTITINIAKEINLENLLHFDHTRLKIIYSLEDECFLTEAYKQKPFIDSKLKKLKVFEKIDTLFINVCDKQSTQDFPNKFLFKFVMESIRNNLIHTLELKNLFIKICIEDTNKEISCLLELFLIYNLTNKIERFYFEGTNSFMIYSKVKKNIILNYVPDKDESAYEFLIHRIEDFFEFPFEHIERIQYYDTRFNKLVNKNNLYGFKNLKLILNNFTEPSNFNYYYNEDPSYVEPFGDDFEDQIENLSFGEIIETKIGEIKVENIKIENPFKFNDILKKVFKNDNFINEFLN